MEHSTVSHQTGSTEILLVGISATTMASPLVSIVGNDEAPKSLYIVPWKSSEIGVETSFNTMLNEDDVPVDRDVFSRELDYYQIRTGMPEASGGDADEFSVGSR